MNIQSISPKNVLMPCYSSIHPLLTDKKIKVAYG